MKWLGFLMLVPVLLSACVGNTPLPDEHYYRLAIAPATERAASARIQGLVVVEPPDAPDVYAKRALVYSEDSGNISLQHYHYHFWIDPPPRLLQQELIRYLQAANLATAVVAEAGRAQPDYRISGSLRRFERLKTGKDWKVAVALQLRVEGASGTSPVLVRDYEQLLAASDATLEASVQAFSSAISTILRQFTTDLTKTLPP